LNLKKYENFIKNKNINENYSTIISKDFETKKNENSLIIMPYSQNLNFHQENDLNKLIIKNHQEEESCEANVNLLNLFCNNLYF